MTQTNWRFFPINSDVKVKIDEEDYKKVELFKWYIHKNDNIPTRNIPNGGIYFNHKLRMTDTIMGIKPMTGFDVEFLNGDNLDFRKSNLKVVSAPGRILGKKTKTK